MGSKLKIWLLGRLEWRYENGSCPDLKLPRPATTKSQSLLAYLVCHRQVSHARERLMTMYWGERPERRARRSLSTALWHIRRCLPSDNCLLGDAHTIAFDFSGNLWVDSEQFEKLATRSDASSLQAAADLYRGDFMDGFYDDWIINERYRLENLFIDLLAQLIDAYEVSGDHAAALEIALRLLQMDSLREEAHRAAMRALCQLGRRHDALAQYERCQAVVREELDAEPMAETTRLYQAIVEGRFEIAPQPFIGHSPPKVLIQPGTGRNPLDVVSAISLVGRERELAFLTESWQLGQAGECSLVLVNGEAGVGKTRLVQEFSAPLHWQGVRILQGRCYEFERVLPYQPVAEALRSLPPTLAETVATEAPGWVASQVARLAPDLFAATPKDAARETGGKQTQLFEGVTRFLAGLATREPLLLVFEDLHWATDSTLQLLHYLARHLTGQPLLIVGTLRPEAVSPGHALATLGRRLERDGMARRLQLHPLSERAVEALIIQLAGDGESVKPLARRLFRETEGNPFYLIETIKTLFEQDAIRLEGGVWQADFVALSQANLPLPASVEETIQARVERLQQDTQEAMQLAAVVGKEFDFDLLDVAWKQGRDAVLEAVDDLLRRRLISEGFGDANADYLFTHHKIQEVVYQGLPLRRRQYLHGQVGLALEQLGVPENGAGELAFHFEQAQQLDSGLTEKAIGYLQQAGQEAGRKYANVEAIKYYRRALTLLEETVPDKLRTAWQIEIAGQLHENIGNMLELTGQHEEAKDAYERALALILDKHPIWRSRLYRKIGKVWEIQSQYDQTLQSFERAEFALGQEPAESVVKWRQEWVQIQLERMWLCYWRDQWYEISKLVDKARHIVEQHGTPSQHISFLLCQVSGDFIRNRYVVSEETLDSCRVALKVSRESGNTSEIAWAHFMMGFAQLWRGELDEAEEHLQSALELAERTGDVVHQSRCLTYLTIIYRKRNRIEEVRHYISRSKVVAIAAQMLEYVGMAEANLAWVAWCEGNLPEVTEKGKAALEVWLQLPVGHASCSFKWTALWPLMGAELARYKTMVSLDEVIGYALILLEPTQQLLHEPLMLVVAQAVEMWREGEQETARTYLDRAIVMSQELGFL